MVSFEVTQEDIDIAAKTAIGEARNQGPEGMEAVIWVMRNRVEEAIKQGKPERWGNTLASVGRFPKQFSAWNLGDPNRSVIDRPGDQLGTLYHEAKSLVFGVMNADPSQDPTGGADHYKVVGHPAAWAEGREPITTIGNHEFYLIGMYGEKGVRDMPRSIEAGDVTNLASKALNALSTERTARAATDKAFHSMMKGCEEAKKGYAEMRGTPGLDKDKLDRLVSLVRKYGPTAAKWAGGPAIGAALTAGASDEGSFTGLLSTIKGVVSAIGGG